MKKPNMFSGLGDFLVLWGSSSISALGTAMTSFALVVWVYSQKGTATSITLLSFCTMLPSILLGFAAGAIADRWEKKRTMLMADFLVLAMRAVVLFLHLMSALRIWHLYALYAFQGFIAAFRDPASYVATSLLVPSEQRVRAAGLQSLSGSIVAILAPALGSVALKVGGLRAILMIDLATFTTALLTLAFVVRIPSLSKGAREAGESLLSSLMAGVRFLTERTALLRMILFFSLINLLAMMGGYGMMAPFVLGRTGGDQAALGVVQSSAGAGNLLGGILVTLSRPAKSRMNAVFFSCGLSFLLGDVMQGLTRSAWLWSVAAFLGAVPLAFVSANSTAVMRANVPLEMQGRVISARNTIQFGTIPIGLLLGGFLADKVFEPAMATAREGGLASILFGRGPGSGMAVIFFIVGTLGAVVNFVNLGRPLYETLDRDDAEPDRDAAP